MPGGTTYESPSSIEAQTKDAWSAEPDDGHEPDDGSYDDARHGRSGSREDDEYALLQAPGANDDQHPGRPVSWGGVSNVSDMDTGYHGGPDREYGEPAASALSPGGYRDNGRADFPKANYTFSSADR